MKKKFKRVVAWLTSSNSATRSFAQKISVFLLMFFFQMTNLFSQTQGGTWTWMSGDAGAGVAAYGTQGVSSASNKPPGLMSPISWTDLSGRFWLYGGYGDSPLSQVQANLWMFDPSTQVWTWVKGPGAISTALDPVYGTQGVSSPANTPGSRRMSCSWTDNSGNLWLFGGIEYYNQSNSYNDLWKYNISTNEWTWMKGSNSTGDPGTYGTIGVSNAANNPAGRALCNATWTDNSGNLWLFGGARSMMSYSASNALNDLWKYDVSTNNWIWMSGSNTPGDYGSWGTMGVPNASNRPGGRSTSFRWKDNAGNLWLYGGLGIAGNGASYTYLNDLWKYNISTNMWTWVNGTQQSYMAGSMSTSCSENNTNRPSDRFDVGAGGACMVDKCGNFWLYGGEIGMGWSDDRAIWRYNPSTNKWAWSGNLSGTPNYGTLGVSNTSNNPPAPRPQSSGWFDLNGNLWTGFGTDVIDWHFKNDLWKFTPDYCSCVNCAFLNINATASASVACPGSSVTLSATGANSYIWSPSTGLSSTTGASVTATPSTTTTYTVIGTSACASDTATVTVTVNAPINVQITPSSTNSCTGFPTVYLGYGSPSQILTASVSGGVAPYTYQWSNGATTQSVSVSPTNTTSYTVTATDAFGCTNSTEIKVKVIDVRESKGNSNTGKVYICHNNHTIAISVSAVPAHLAHGDCLGTCDEDDDNDNHNSNCHGNNGHDDDNDEHGNNGNHHGGNHRLASSHDENSSIEEEPATLSIYPNPNTGNFTIKSTTSGTYNVINELGQTIQTVKLNTSNSFNVNIEGLCKGIYYIIGSGNNISVKQKLIITE